MSTTSPVGARLRSTVCSTEVVIIRIDDTALELNCGGVAMTPVESATTALAGGTPLPGFDGGSAIGKRYGDAGDPVELLCTKAGAGSLSVGDHILAERRAKPLPASD